MTYFTTTALQRLRDAAINAGSYLPRRLMAALIALTLASQARAQQDWGSAADNVTDVTDNIGSLLNAGALLAGAAFAIYGWVLLTNKRESERNGKGQAVLMIVIGAMLIIWRVVVQYNAGTVFGSEGSGAVEFIDQ